MDPETEYHDEMHVVRGPLRWVLLGLGWLFVALGVAGAILPVLPTTPFILVAAACFARSSEHFYAWLLGNRIFGPLVRDWRAHRAIARRSKWLAIGLITVFVGSSALWYVENPWGRGALVLTGVALVTFLARLPNREDVGAEPPAHARPDGRDGPPERGGAG